ncbi:unnamed protein product [Lactuca saligna]|uniref:non-specific serine/threonine protein kinase n=1 Tax=Lactuca saligna TaxID=75948 RepID=A0AA35V943_LACSI|nr:unnamed protein product [Lactuca saligna]
MSAPTTPKTPLDNGQRYTATPFDQLDFLFIHSHRHQYQQTMPSPGLNLENYVIPLEEINRATKNFSSERLIGSGGFGKVYKGKLSERWQNLTVAIKRLDHDSYQGEIEFRNELDMFSRFHHENIISFIGYCNESNEMIIVYKYAINRSIDYHLQDPDKRRSITWTHRLKICIGAARGLDYLHWGLNEHQRVIHRDVKSANILLDENLVAKVCDFGLSKLGTKNQPNTQLYTNTKVAGTHFYLDPTYQESGILSKESDVYSFGVVLFEILSGMLVYSKRKIGDDRPRALMKFVRRYHENEPEKLIDPYIRDQIDSRSFNTFIQIAYQCISLNLKERPPTNTIIQRIEEALSIQESVDAFIKCVTADMGFSNGIPVAAFTIYKCVLHWKYLEAEKTNIFERLIQIYISEIEVQNNNNQMAYWLSSACTFLFLIQKSVILDHSTSLVEKPSPPALVTMKLTAHIEKMYAIICENLKKELGPLLAQAPRISKGVLKDSESNGWEGIVDCLNTLVNTLKENFVPHIIIEKIIPQIFSYINVQLFNSVLVRRECCTFSNCEYVKAGLVELQQWCCKEKEEYVCTAWDELVHIRHAIKFMTMHHKYRLSCDEITIDLCPILSIQQMYRISSLYWDDKLDTRSVSEDVFSSMRIMMTQDFNDVSILLEDSFSVLFSVDDLCNSFQVENFANVKPAVQLATYPAFDFLYK